MSERPDGIPEATPPKPRDSAVVVLARKDEAGEWELLMGLRSRKSGFFPGHWAFPGGGLEPQDEPNRPGAFARCGSRELLEETGVRVRPDRLHSIGFKTTPPFHPVRYRTEFFLGAAPAHFDPASNPSPRENEELRFVQARAALEAWEDGTMFFPPPLPPMLRVFTRERSAPFDTLPRMLTMVNEYEERVPRIEFVPWVWMYPVHSPTLPPATHTNIWIAGGARTVIVDCGASEAWDLQHLQLVIERRKRIGGVPEAILLTHHHRDHVLGAALLADELQIPVRCHPETAEALRGYNGALQPDLVDGTRLDLGGLTMIVHHTPGHAPGHVALEIPERRAALVGDLLSGFSTIVIPPDDGDMAQYLESLRRVRALDVNLLLPSHGPPMRADALDTAIAHRLEREARVVAALREEPRPLAEIAVEAYADTPGAPQPLAEIQALAHLRKLEREWRARACEGGAWASDDPARERPRPGSAPDAADDPSTNADGEGI